MKLIKIFVLIIFSVFCLSGCSIEHFGKYRTCYGKTLSSICNQDFGICLNIYCKEQYDACLKTANEFEDNVLNQGANDLICR